MIHAGSVIAAGISQGKSTTFRRDFRIFRYFRDDHEKRDFVVGGASGMLNKNKTSISSIALKTCFENNLFYHCSWRGRCIRSTGILNEDSINLRANPHLSIFLQLGGVLFALEEAATYWNQALIWKALIASIISSFTLNVILSWYHSLKTFSYPGLFNLGQFEPLPYEYFEIPIFVLMGMFGGLIGALWNSVNIKLTIFRSKYGPIS